MDASINDDRNECFKKLGCKTYIRNIVAYIMSFVMGLIQTYLSSKNLLDNKHLYLILLFQFINFIIVFIKSDVSLNSKLQETKKELKNQIETNNFNNQRLSNHSSVQTIHTPVNLPQLNNENV